jgi:hypothetical protein
MPTNNQYPVKILENLYVLDVANPRGFEKEEFLTLSKAEMMDFLIFKDPSFSFKNGTGGKKIYTPSFGNFIISIFEERPLKYYDLDGARKKSEELYKIFNDEYLKMAISSCKLENLINPRTPFNLGDFNKT